MLEAVTFKTLLIDQTGKQDGPLRANSWLAPDATYRERGIGPDTCCDSAISAPLLAFVVGGWTNTKRTGRGKVFAMA